MNQRKFLKEASAKRASEARKEIKTSSSQEAEILQKVFSDDSTKPEKSMALQKSTSCTLKNSMSQLITKLIHFRSRKTWQPSKPQTKKNLAKYSIKANYK